LVYPLEILFTKYRQYNGRFTYNVIYKEEGRVRTVEPFTFGIVATGIFGGGLLVIAALEKSGVQINEEMLTIVMEVVKYGVLLKFFALISGLFL
jgi:hypothetical protein